MPGIGIADNSRVGAGSVVIKDLGIEGGFYFGNPAKLKSK
jgi:acetyltransferase-like isoleucine patch superfamily enzyme